MKRLFVSLVVLATWRINAGHKTTLEAPQDALGGNELLQAASIPLSPQCWSHALQTMQDAQHESHDISQEQHAWGRTTCSDMSHRNQQFLAFELTRCHMESVGRPLLDEDCDTSKLIHDGTLRTCLSRISDSTLNAYTHFFTYINQVCMRLTQELAAARHYETAMMLADASQRATETMSRIKSLQNEVLDEFQQHQNRLILQQQDKLNATSHLAVQSMSKIGIKRDEILGQQEEMKKKQAEIIQHQNELFIAFQEKMKQHGNDVQEVMSQAFDTALGRLQPLLNVESFIWRAAIALKSFLRFLGTLMLAWLLTIPGLCRRGRRPVVLLVIIEASVEVVVHCVAQEGVIAHSQRDNVAYWLRSWAFSLECGLYLLGIARSFIGRPNHDMATEEVVKDLQDRLMRQLQQRSEQMRKEQIGREQQLLQLLSHTMQDSNRSIVPQQMAYSARPVAQVPPPPGMHFSGGYEPLWVLNTPTVMQRSPSNVEQSRPVETRRPVGTDHAVLNNDEVSSNTQCITPAYSPVYPEPTPPHSVSEDTQHTQAKRQPKRRAEDNSEELAVPEHKKQRSETKV